MAKDETDGIAVSKLKSRELEACQQRALKFDGIFTPWEAKHRDVLKVVDTGELTAEIWAFESSFIDVLLWENEENKKRLIEGLDAIGFHMMAYLERKRMESGGHSDFRSLLRFHIEQCNKLFERLNRSHRDAKRDGRPVEAFSEILAPLRDYQLEIETIGREIDAKTNGPATATTEQYSLRTSQEADILFSSGCSGKFRRDWRNNDGRDVRIYEPPGASHRVELARYFEDGEGLPWDALEELTDAQDSDFVIAAHYVFGVLAPPEALPYNRQVVEWIDLNHLMEKIGWLAQKPNPAKREVLRRKLYNYLVFGAQAKVVGRRSIPYFDPYSKEVISTQIEGAPWHITEKLKPKQGVLFREHDPVPVAVQISLSKQWEPLLLDPRLAQHLPLGELLGAIPPNKVGGDWARSIGLCLARLWRMKPREAVAGNVNPTRREILTHYAPKTKGVQELLDSTNPKRAVEHYLDALNILLQNGLISQAGDVEKDITVAKLLSRYPAYNWAKAWLDGLSGLRPGAKWEPPLITLRDRKFEDKPRDLKAPQKRRALPKAR